MSFGQITSWDYSNDFFNYGAVRGCFDVLGYPFYFYLSDVDDPGLALFLRTYHDIKRPANCVDPPHKYWVAFIPSGNHATHLVRRYPTLALF